MLGRHIAGLIGSVVGMLAATGVAEAWDVPTLPLPVGVTSSVLTGVACVSASACVAVGNGARDSETFGEQAHCRGIRPAWPA